MLRGSGFQSQDQSDYVLSKDMVISDQTLVRHLWFRKDEFAGLLIFGEKMCVAPNSAQHRLGRPLKPISVIITVHLF